ncbi:hypothetical protein WSM22_46740 [Cytophagales bacterium WSM2-2]|nr:hypothetical protein WSM22_46740 [Cytophagales bacterium WSM2-2]
MINAFEYVTVFISIILGLGVTQILTGIADLVHQKERVKVYWPHTVWVLLALILHVQEWWVIFELRTFERWRLPTFLFIMLYPTVLFILARLLFPFGYSEGAIDLKEFYYKNYRKIFLFVSILAMLSILDNLIMRQYVIEDLVGPSVVFISFSSVALIKSKKQWVHQLMAALMLSMLTLTIIIQWDEWLIAN